MWHDNEASIDLLGYERFAKTICSLTRQNDLLPVTIGLFGDWGSGKSSVLGMVEQTYAEQPDSLCLRFDGWLFEGYDDAKAALMTDIIEGIKAKKKDAEGIAERIKSKTESLLKRVDWFRLAGLAAKGIVSLTTPLGPLGLINSLTGGASNVAKKIMEDPSGSVEQLRGLVRPEAKELWENIRVFRKEFEDLILESKLSPIVILIDDLDRCLPDSIISTLEAIKLFLSVKGTVFVIAADERIIRHAINHRYPPEKYEEQDLPQDYLEKIIQVPLKLPVLIEEDVTCYMYLLFAQRVLGSSRDKEFLSLCKRANENRRRRDLPEPMNYGIAAEVLGNSAKVLQSDFALVDRITPPLTKGLDGNPRLIKRFLNTLSLRLTMAQAMGLDLQSDILCKLMLLERFHEERFIELFKWQSVQNGIAEEIPNLKKALAEGDNKKLTDEEKVWLLDEDLKRWLVSEPELDNVSLTEYFYIARETIRISTKGSKQLPPDLQELLAKLQSKTESIQQKAAKDLARRQPEEISSVYEGIILKAVKKPRDKGMLGLIKLSNINENVARRLILDLEKVDPASMNGPLVFKIGIFKNTYPSLSSDVDKLLNEWTACSIRTVAKAAEKALKPSAISPKPTRGLSKGIYGGN